MAKVFLHAGGGVVGVRRTAAEEAFAPLPADSSQVVTFDEDANAAVLADLGRTTTPFTIVAGVLRKNGSPVAIQPDGDRAALKSAAASAVAANDTYLAIASPSNAQNAAQIRALTQQNNRLIKRLVQLSQ